MLFYTILKTIRILFRLRMYIYRAVETPWVHLNSRQHCRPLVLDLSHPSQRKYLDVISDLGKNTINVTWGYKFHDTSTCSMQLLYHDRSSQMPVACNFCIIHDIYIISYRLKRLHATSCMEYNLFYFKMCIIIL